MDKPISGSETEDPTARQNSQDGMYFENIDIEPNLHIPSPQQSMWTRFWQPIGTTIMDTEVLKEPKGFIKFLEWIFCMIPVIVIYNYNTYMEYRVFCTEESGGARLEVRYNFSYPFRLSQGQDINVTCGQTSVITEPPGDFSSDAHFFIFTGLFSFVSIMVVLVIYVFFSNIYHAQDKRAPLLDFCYTGTMAILWLSGTAAWANGLSGLKNVANGEWMDNYGRSICTFDEDGHYELVEKCKLIYKGNFAGGNISVLLGLVNCVLWSGNMWFVFKETSWFINRGQEQIR